MRNAAPLIQDNSSKMEQQEPDQQQAVADLSPGLPGPWPGQKCAVMIIIHYSLTIINLHTWLICFFQLFFWRACLSRYALLVLVCMSAFVVV